MNDIVNPTDFLLYIGCMVTALCAMCLCIKPSKKRRVQQ